MIIDDVGSKPPYLSGIFETVDAWKKSVLKLIIRYVVRVYIDKGENMQTFLFDVFEYVNFTDRRYVGDYCLH